MSSWIHQLETTLNRCLDDVEAISVRGAIIKFVARFFITHGAGCFDFINGIKAHKTEKLDDVANLIVESQEDCIVAGLSKQEFSHFLVSIFSKDKTVEQEAYLLIQLRKAIQYISMVVDAPSGVVSAVPLAVLSWIAKTAWKKIRGNIGGFLTVSSN